MENKNEPLFKDEEEKIFMGADTSSLNNEDTEEGKKISETPILVRKNVEKNVDDTPKEDHVIPGILISKREIATEEEKEASQPIETPKATPEVVAVSEEQPVISEIPITPIIAEDEGIENSKAEEIPEEPAVESKAEVNIEPQVEQSVVEDTPVIPETQDVVPEAPVVEPVVAPTEPIAVEEQVSNELVKEETPVNSENVYTAINTIPLEGPVVSSDAVEPVVSEVQEVKPASTGKKVRDTKKIVTIAVTLTIAIITLYLLVQTCIGFYYGFKYKNYIAAQNETTQTTP